MTQTQLFFDQYGVLLSVEPVGNDPIPSDTWDHMLDEYEKELQREYEEARASGEIKPSVGYIDIASPEERDRSVEYGTYCQYTDIDRMNSDFQELVEKLGESRVLLHTLPAGKKLIEENNK